MCAIKDRRSATAFDPGVRPVSADPPLHRDWTHSGLRPGGFGELEFASRYGNEWKETFGSLIEKRAGRRPSHEWAQCGWKQLHHLWVCMSEGDFGNALLHVYLEIKVVLYSSSLCKFSPVALVLRDTTSPVRCQLGSFLLCYLRTLSPQDPLFCLTPLSMI